jgi:threonine dehydrogenase-like Zn-dependent dehydrogenase
VVAEINRITNGKGADFVLECSGAVGTFQQAIEISAFRGTIALIGFYENLEKEINIDAIVSKALFIFGVMGEFDNMSGVLNVLEKHKPDISPIITHELPFGDCENGFVRKNYPNAIKIAVKINEEN